MKITKYLTNALFSLLLLIGAGGAPAVENVVYFHNDALGSPVAATDGQGQLLWTEDYEPYGKRLEKPATSNQLWFTGKPEESELGLSYFGARWYEPEIGRFHGIDPVDFQEGNIQSFNRYAYANNNPYGFVDPDGRSPEKPRPLGIQGGVGGAGNGGGATYRLYLGPVQYHGPKPKYVENPAHFHNGRGRAVNPEKDVLPSDAGAAYKRAVPDVTSLYKAGNYEGQPRIWWATGEKGQIYRYFHGRDGTAHYSGTFSIESTVVPKVVKDRLFGRAGMPPGTKPGTEKREPLS